MPVIWPVSVRRILRGNPDNRWNFDYDQIVPYRPGDIDPCSVEPNDLHPLLSYLWEFLRTKDSVPALVIEPGLPPMLLAAIILRLAPYYKVVVLDKVVVYSTYYDIPLGSTL